MALFYFRGGFDWLNEWANQDERAQSNKLRETISNIANYLNWFVDLDLEECSENK